METNGAKDQPVAEGDDDEDEDEAAEPELQTVRSAGRMCDAYGMADRLCRKPSS